MTEDFYSTPEAELQENLAPRNLERIKWAVLFLLVPYGVCFGALSWKYRPNGLPPVLDWSTYVVMVLICYAWFRLDVRQRGVRRSLLWDLVLILGPGVALVPYLFRSRGWKGGALAFLLMLACGLAFVLSFTFGSMTFAIYQGH